MPRKLFIAGNWKMNTSSASAAELAEALVEKLASVEAIDLAAGPPFVPLQAVGKILAGSPIALGAQDIFYENDGAYTGEISAAMLKDVGCSNVLCGHSERRHVIGETDELINRKLLKALSEGLRPGGGGGCAPPPPPARRRRWSRARFAWAWRASPRRTWPASRSPTSRSGRSARAWWQPPIRPRKCTR